MSEFQTSSVYERLSDHKENRQSNKSRLIVFLLSLFLPIGTHNYYLGYYIKGIAQTGVAIVIALFMPPLFFVIFLSIFMAYMTSEGLRYLLWYKVKDGDDFPLYNPKKPSIPKKKKAILLAFLLPFGLHHFYLGNFKRAYLAWGFVSFMVIHNILYIFIPVIFSSLYPILFVLVISWIEGSWMLIKDQKL